MISCLKHFKRKFPFSWCSTKAPIHLHGKLIKKKNPNHFYFPGMYKLRTAESYGPVTVPSPANGWPWTAQEWHGHQRKYHGGCGCGVYGHFVPGCLSCLALKFETSVMTKFRTCIITLTTTRAARVWCATQLFLHSCISVEPVRSHFNTCLESPWMWLKEIMLTKYI